MSSTGLSQRPTQGTAVELALIGGDLQKLNVAERLSYYNQLCTSLDLNPLTKPFEYIVLNGKLTLYARKDCTEQLRSKRGVSIQIVAREVTEDCYIVTAQASLATGRKDESIGAVSISGLKGEARANALMKAETKAKRRVTLSICGLGMLDETEIETIQNAAPTGYTVHPVTTPEQEGSNSAVGEAQIDSAPKSGASGSSRSPAFVATQHGEEIPDDGRLYIARVDITDTKNKNVQKALVTFSDDRQASTIKTPLMNLCAQFCQERTPVLLTPEDVQDTKWGLNLLDIRRDDDLPDPCPDVKPGHLGEPLEPLDERDIPF